MSEFASRFFPTRFISFRLFTYTERNCQEHCYGYRKTLASFMDRIEHGLDEDSTLCQVRCFKWQEYAQTTLSFRTILQPRANYKHVECLKHATGRSYRVRLAMLLTHSLFLFASTRTPMRTERNPLPAFGILLLSLSFSRIVSHY